MHNISVCFGVSHMSWHWLFLFYQCITYYTKNHSWCKTRCQKSFHHEKRKALTLMLTLWNMNCESHLINIQCDTVSAMNVTHFSFLAFSSAAWSFRSRMRSLGLIFCTSDLSRSVCRCTFFCLWGSRTTFTEMTNDYSFALQTLFKLCDQSWCAKVVDVHEIAIGVY